MLRVALEDDNQDDGQPPGRRHAAQDPDAADLHEARREDAAVHGEDAELGDGYDGWVDEFACEEELLKQENELVLLWAGGFGCEGHDSPFGL